MKLVAMNDAIVIRLLEMEEKKKGSIVVLTDNNHKQMQTGEIVSVGPLAFQDYVKYYDLELPDVIGKTVVFELIPALQQYFDMTLEDGCKYKLIRDKDVMAFAEGIK